MASTVKESLAATAQPKSILKTSSSKGSSVDKEKEPTSLGLNLESKSTADPDEDVLDNGFCKDADA